MRYHIIPTLLLLVCSVSSLQAAPPNIVIVLADDLGYSDLGCYGGEIETPQLDALAQHGLRFSEFHNTGRCWPTRASLLTGYYAQAVRRDTVPGVVSGGRGQRPDWAPLVTEYLSRIGYRCYHSGKWHIDGMPLQNGFDHSYYLQDQGRFFSPTQHFRDDQPLPAVARDSGYYGTTAIGDAAVEYLRAHEADQKDAPFFLYLAFTAPHFPLQAPQELIDHYLTRYAVGWDAIRAKRWERQQELVDLHTQLSAPQLEVGPPYAFPDAIEKLGPGEINRPLPWNELSEQQRLFQTEKMAIHAAMVHAMDEQIGRVVSQLSDMQALDNTLLLFLSDNGASAEIMVRDDGHDPQAPAGSADSYLCLGPGWSTVCNTPFRFHKTWVHEGGIATPAIIHWPAANLPAGQWTEHVTHVVDVVPTLLDLVGREDPPTNNQQPPFAGQSFKSVLTAGNVSPERPLYWHHEGNRAIREGGWKLVATNNGPWELYDLDQDRAETNNLAAQHPDRVRQMADHWQSLHNQQINWAQ